MTVSPGSTIGIVGGGQLGRMLALAAANLGYRCHIYAPEESPCAADVSARFTRGRYDDEEQLRRFGGSVDVATFEFENIPAGPLDALARETPLFPPPRSLSIAQDRLSEKRFVEELGGRCGAYRSVAGEEELREALAGLGTPALLKTRRLGYDGKGQVRIDRPEAAEAAWKAVGGAPSLLEQFVTFDAEFSILLCRGRDGTLAFWEAPRNVHVGGILRHSIVPAPPSLAPAIEEARGLASRVAEALDHVGVMALEFFACGEKALFNELAPRVHNSGHWTIEGALASQFENHVRAICGLPLGGTALVAPSVEMRNLIGDEAERWPELLAEPGAHLHLYGKEGIRPGRKMGHVTRLGSGSSR